MSNTPATLLIVDDDVHVRQLLESLLQDQGYRTLTADSGSRRWLRWRNNHRT